MFIYFHICSYIFIYFQFPQFFNFLNSSTIRATLYNKTCLSGVDANFGGEVKKNCVFHPKPSISAIPYFFTHKTTYFL